MFTKISIHRVGNKINQEGLFLSEGELILDEDMREFLSDFFIKSFKSEEKFQFYVSEIFEDKDWFHEHSQKIAKYLYEITDNPRVLSGECCVVYFEDDSENGEKMDSLGIFKMEKKDTFLKVLAQDENFQVNKDFGFNLSKIDKGCMIYNIQ